MVTLLSLLLACHQTPSLVDERFNLCRSRYSSILIITNNRTNSNKEYFPLFNQSSLYISINSFIPDTRIHLEKLPHSLILLNSPENSTLKAMLSLKHHVIVILGMRCDKIMPSKWNVDLYCWNGNTQDKELFNS